MESHPLAWLPMLPDCLDDSAWPTLAVRPADRRLIGQGHLYCAAIMGSDGTEMLPQLVRFEHHEGFSQPIRADIAVYAPEFGQALTAPRVIGAVLAAPPMTDAGVYLAEPQAPSVQRYRAEQGVTSATTPAASAVPATAPDAATSARRHNLFWITATLIVGVAACFFSSPPLALSLLFMLVPVFTFFFASWHAGIIGLAALFCQAALLWNHNRKIPDGADPRPLLSLPGRVMVAIFGGISVLATLFYLFNWTNFMLGIFGLSLWGALCAILASMIVRHWRVGYVLFATSIAIMLGVGTLISLR